MLKALKLSAPISRDNAKWSPSMVGTPRCGVRAPLGKQSRTAQRAVPTTVYPLVIIPLLACLDLDVENVLWRWQRTGGECSERAWRVLRLVEIKHCFSVHRFVGI